MKLLLLLFLPLLLFSKVHYAKIQPYEDITIKASVSGEVIQAKINFEGKIIHNDVLIRIDNKLDKIKLKSSQNSMKLLNSMILTNQKILTALNASLQRQKSYYQKIENVMSASLTQKDNAFYSYTNAKTQYFSTKEKIDSLKKQKLDLKYEMARLKESVSKKVIRIHNKFIDKLLVHKGDFVNMGTPLAQVKDLSSGKLVLFLEADELKDIKKKSILIDDKISKHKISKIWKVTDEKYISSYRTEIVIKNPKESFSKLLKVEFR